jgi:hypothetical protein
MELGMFFKTPTYQLDKTWHHHSKNGNIQNGGSMHLDATLPLPSGLEMDAVCTDMFINVCHF